MKCNEQRINGNFSLYPNTGIKIPRTHTYILTYQTIEYENRNNFEVTKVTNRLKRMK